MEQTMSFPEEVIVLTDWPLSSVWKDMENKLLVFIENWLRAKVDVLCFKKMDVESFSLINELLTIAKTGFLEKLKDEDINGLLQEITGTLGSHPDKLQSLLLSCHSRLKVILLQ